MASSATGGVKPVSGLSRACTDAASAGIMNLSIKKDAVKVHRLRRLTNDSIKRITCGEARVPAAYIAVGHWNSVGTAQFAEVKKIRCETPLPPYASGTIRYRRS